MADRTISDDRATGIRRMLLVTLGLAVVLAVVAILLLLNDFAVYGGIVLVIAVVLGTSGYRALRAVRDRLPQARRMSIVTGVALCVLSLPLMPIWVGLITVVAGIGLLVVTVAPEREQR